MEQNVDEYNAMDRWVGLIPEGTQHTGEKNLEVKLIKDWDDKGVVSMIGAVDIVGVFIPCLKNLVRGYKNKIANKNNRILGMK